MVDTSEVRVVTIVRFRSRLPEEEVRARYLERMPQFRKVPGLVQKYYYRDESTGELGGVYMWHSEEAARDYLASDLRKSIPAAYEIEGVPRVDSVTVIDRLR